MAQTNLTDVVEAATKDDGRMKQIAEAAQTLVHTHLCEEARRCYLYELLRRYGRKMAYVPSPEERGALRVTNAKQLIQFADTRANGRQNRNAKTDAPVSRRRTRLRPSGVAPRTEASGN